MTKLRKMLGDINSEECIAMMHLIETQSKTTLASWAVTYVKEHYLTIYEEECQGDVRLRDTIAVCEEYLQGDKKLTEVKPILREAAQIARDITDNPIAQAAARAIATACAVIQTPTNTLGFIFYGAAVTAYSKAGLEETVEIYDELARGEFKRAYNSLEKVSVPDEANPAKIKWNC